MTETGGPTRVRTIRDAIGPGLLFAGAAIGVSHLVQSTQAGALYGLLLIPVIFLAHGLKLPGMLAGPRYAAATGRTLIEAYTRQGRHAIIAFALVTAGTMFIIQAAVTMVCGAIVNGALIAPVFGQPVPTWLATAGVMGLCAGVLALGGFAWLDRVIKGLMLVMLIATLAAGVSVLPSLTLDGAFALPGSNADRLKLLVFAVILFGWMPAPLDIAVWNSIWTLERERQTSSTPSRRACEIDFFIGYAMCVVLAMAFMLLGEVLMRQKAVAPASTGPAIAVQVINLYTGAIGEWVRPVISACAIAVMLSTCLTVQDALARTVVLTMRSLPGRRSATSREHPASAGSVRTTSTVATNPRAYWLAAGVIGAGAMGLVFYATASGAGFRRLIDVAMILSFLSAPVLAWFNHRAMREPDIPEEFREGRAWRAASWACLAGLTLFAAVFVWTQI